MAVLRSEPLGPEQGHQQVGREAGEGQREQDEVEAHGSTPLAGEKVAAEQDEGRRRQHEHRDIQHIHLRREASALVRTGDALDALSGLSLPCGRREAALSTA